MKRCAKCGKKISHSRYAKLSHDPDYCSATCENAAKPAEKAAEPEAAGSGKSPSPPERNGTADGNG